MTIILTDYEYETSLSSELAKGNVGLCAKEADVLDVKTCFASIKMSIVCVSPLTIVFSWLCCMLIVPCSMFSLVSGCGYE